MRKKMRMRNKMMRMRTNCDSCACCRSRSGVVLAVESCVNSVIGGVLSTFWACIGLDSIGVGQDVLLFQCIIQISDWRSC